MQSVDSREKLTVLILLVASTMLGVLARDFAPPAEAAQSGPTSGRLLFAAALAAGLIAVLMLLSPGKTHRSLRATLRDFWPQLLGLAGLVAGYAFILQPLGFFPATSLFLVIGSMLLGERRIGALFLFSVPVALALGLILEGAFGLALHDPLMHALGWTV
ncbi:MAG: tripartite tricarboxylate transporter TctB family protein [Rhizobiales bacterium]|nr:tripartite tricarboxylate transporter TctB family protein [Hyphomicrobiales bacterium]